MAWFNWGESDTLEDKHWKRRAAWVTPVLDLWVKILRSCFQRSHCDGDFRSLYPRWLGPVGPNEHELVTNWSNEHELVWSPRSSGKFQKCWTARNLVISQGFDRSEWNMALCIEYKWVFCFLFDSLGFVLQDWMNKVRNLTGCYLEVASLFFSTSLLYLFSSFTGWKVGFLTKADLGVVMRFWLIAGLRNLISWNVSSVTLVAHLIVLCQCLAVPTGIFDT